MNTRISLLSILLLLIAQFLLAKPAIQKQSYYRVNNVAGATGGLNDGDVGGNLMGTIQARPLVLPDSSGFTHSDSLCEMGETCFSDQIEPIKAGLEPMNSVGNCKRFQLRLLADVTIPAGAEKVFHQNRIYDPVFSDERAHDAIMVFFKLKPSTKSRVMKKGTKSIVELCDSGKFNVISSEYFIGIDSLYRKTDGTREKLDVSNMLFLISGYYDWVHIK